MKTIALVLICILLAIPGGSLLATGQSYSDAVYVVDLQTRSMIGNDTYELFFKPSSVKLYPVNELNDFEHVRHGHELLFQVVADIKVIPLLDRELMIEHCAEVLSQYLSADHFPLPEAMKKNEEVSAETRQMMIWQFARILVTQTFGEAFNKGDTVIRSGVSIPVYIDQEQDRHYLLIFDSRVYL